MAIESLPLQPGDWGPLSQHLIAIEAVTTTGALPEVRYRLVSDGTTVTAYDQLGAVVATGTDGGAVLTACLPAANSVGATIDFRNDGQIFPWSTVPALPKGITNKLLIRGNGSTVRLSASGPRFLDLNKTADYDTFQNFEITDFLFDANNVAGSHHVVFGTYINGVVQSRINVQDIAIRRIKTINVPVDATAVTSDRRNVCVMVSHTAASETQTNIQRIVVEDVDFRGGNVGAQFGGTGIITAGLNVFVDSITVQRWRHSLLTAPTQSGGGVHVHYVSRGFGGRNLVVRDGYGEYSSDVGVEVDAGTEKIIDNVVILDAWNAGFYHTNYNNPGQPGEQRAVFSRCVALRDQTLATTTRGFAFLNNLGISLGEIDIHNCAYYRNATDLIISVGEAIDVAGATQLSAMRIDGFRAVIQGVNYVAAPAITTNVFSFQPSGPTGGGMLTMQNMLARIEGTRNAGAGAVAINGYFIGGSVILAADMLQFYADVTSMTVSGIHGLDLGNGVTTLRGGIRRFQVLNINGDTTPRGMIIRGTGTLTISNQFRIEDCDFSRMAAGTDILFAGAPQNQDKVYFYGNKWRVFPKPSAAMGASNFAASTFTTATGNQYIGGDAAEIHFATGTGSGITQIAVSKDNSTFEEVYTQASGAMAQTVLVPVDNGDSVKVTFATTQPTTRVRFRR